MQAWWKIWLESWEMTEKLPVDTSCTCCWKTTISYLWSQKFRIQMTLAFYHGVPFYESHHIPTISSLSHYLLIPNLVGGLVAIFWIFPYIGNLIIPIDFHIFQRGWNHQPVIISLFPIISLYPTRVAASNPIRIPFKKNRIGIPEKILFISRVESQYNPSRIPFSH